MFLLAIVPIAETDAVIETKFTIALEELTATIVTTSRGYNLIKAGPVEDKTTCRDEVNYNSALQKCVGIKTRVTTSPGDSEFTAATYRQILKDVRTTDFFESKTGYPYVFLPGGTAQNTPTAPFSAIPDAPFPAPVLPAPVLPKPAAPPTTATVFTVGFDVYAIAPKEKELNVIESELLAGFVRLMGELGFTTDAAIYFTADEPVEPDPTVAFVTPNYKLLTVHLNFSTEPFDPAYIANANMYLLEKAFDPIVSKLDYLPNNLSKTVGFRVAEGTWTIGMPIPAMEGELPMLEDYDYENGGGSSSFATFGPTTVTNAVSTTESTSDYAASSSAPTDTPKTGVPTDGPTEANDESAAPTSSPSDAVTPEPTETQDTAAPTSLPTEAKVTDGPTPEPTETKVTNPPTSELTDKPSII